MRCGHCKADGVDRAHVRRCSDGLSRDEKLARRPAEGVALRSGYPALPTPEDAAARAAETVAAKAVRQAEARPTGPAATDRQLAFLRKLADERGIDLAAFDLRALTKRDASALIDDWLQRPLLVEKAGAPELAADSDHLQRGRVHVLDGEYVRVHVGQRSHKPYAVRAVVLREAERAEDGTLLAVGEVDWEYAPGLTWKLMPGTLASAAEAAAFGELVGRCVFCSTPIDTPESTSRGYGPVCAEKNGLPWG